MSYRSNFNDLNIYNKDNHNITSDCGWGCAIRTG